MIALERRILILQFNLSMNKRIALLLSVILLATVNLFAQVAVKPVKSFDLNYKIIFRNPVQDKNFYLLSLFQSQSKARATLQKNETFKALAKQRIEALKNAADCNDVNCYDKAFRLGEEEINTVAKAFETIQIDSALKSLVENHLRPSGMFIRYDKKTDAQMLALAWLDAAKGLNHILDVYGLGKDALYKAIDNANYDVNSDEYKKILKTKVAEINLQKNALFFEPTLAYAMKLLEANRRDEAGRYEPLEKSVNKKAFENIKKIKWQDYPYSVILVLGSGPNAANGDAPNIGKVGMARSDAAVKLFQEKKAPLIIFSGGHVHPANTPYCEAIEMKKYVMQKYGIPEENILVEPQARHTTTNVRNASRLMLRYSIPLDKKGIITSTDTHIDYICEERFTKRNMDELGYVPMQIFKRLSPIEVEFTPLTISLFVNSLETLDP